jgi:hypothetical protein
MQVEGRLMYADSECASAFALPLRIARESNPTTFVHDSKGGYFFWGCLLFSGLTNADICGELRQVKQ